MSRLMNNQIHPLDARDVSSILEYLLSCEKSLSSFKTTQQDSSIQRKEKLKRDATQRNLHYVIFDFLNYTCTLTPPSLRQTTFLPSYTPPPPSTTTTATTKQVKRKNEMIDGMSLDQWTFLSFTILQFVKTVLKSSTRKYIIGSDKGIGTLFNEWERVLMNDWKRRSVVSSGSRSISADAKSEVSTSKMGDVVKEIKSLL